MEYYEQFWYNWGIRNFEISFMQVRKVKSKYPYKTKPKAKQVKIAAKADATVTKPKAERLATLLVSPATKTKDTKAKPLRRVTFEVYKKTNTAKATSPVKKTMSQQQDKTDAAETSPQPSVSPRSKPQDKVDSHPHRLSVGAVEQPKKVEEKKLPLIEEKKPTMSELQRLDDTAKRICSAVVYHIINAEGNQHFNHFIRKICVDPKTRKFNTNEWDEFQNEEKLLPVIKTFIESADYQACERSSIFGLPSEDDLVGYFLTHIAANKLMPILIESRKMTPKDHADRLTEEKKQSVAPNPAAYYHKYMRFIRTFKEDEYEVKEEQEVAEKRRGILQNDEALRSNLVHFITHEYPRFREDLELHSMGTSYVTALRFPGLSLELVSKPSWTFSQEKKSSCCCFFRKKNKVAPSANLANKDKKMPTPRL